MRQGSKFIVRTYLQRQPYTCWGKAMAYIFSEWYETRGSSCTHEVYGSGEILHGDG